jgi:predicted kinase
MSPKDKRPRGHHDRRNSVEFAEPPKPQERPDRRSADYFRSHSTGHDGAPSPRPDVLRRSQHLRRFSSAVSTEKQFQDDKDHSFYGSFAHIRSILDYNYHAHYRKDRQWFQDSIVCDLLENVQETDACITPYEPWLIYTAGAQGTGKTFTIQKLVEEGKLPLLSYVHVDPQEIAYHIPEFYAYNQKCPENADQMTKKEAGYIAEITVLAALQAGRNVILDGALHDYDWWNCFFDQCRTEFTSVKVALFYIIAPRGDIICRIRVRLSNSLCVCILCRVPLTFCLTTYTSELVEKIVGDGAHLARDHD